MSGDRERAVYEVDGKIVGYVTNVRLEGFDIRAWRYPLICVNQCE